MLKLLLKSTKILLISFLFSTDLINAQPSEEKDAWQIADVLLHSLGGKEVWASSNILYIKEKAFPESLFHPVTAEFWRDLEKPAYHSIIKGFDFHRETMWDEQKGWVDRNGKREIISYEDISQEISDWSQQPYVIYHKLAKRDPSIKPALKDNVLQIYDSDDGRLLCWFKVDANGRLLIWGNYYKDEKVEHVYGPTIKIGNYRMPAWGTATNGSWRFEYLEIKAVDNLGAEMIH